MANPGNFHFVNVFPLMPSVQVRIHHAPQAPIQRVLCYHEAMNVNTLENTTPLPCPVCETKLVTRHASRHEALVWCETCGWNLAGSGKYLRGRNLHHFLKTLWFLPLLIPFALFLHHREPTMAYGLDLLLILLMFAPAFVRSQANLALARKIESFQPAGRTVGQAGWTQEPSLAQDSQRPVQLRGTTAPIKGLLTTFRALWAFVFICGLMGFTPLAQIVGPRIQFAAFMGLSLAIAPVFGTLLALFAVMRRDRHLAGDGKPCEGRILFQMTHLKRLAKGEWTLVCRYRYRFTDPHGTVREGKGLEEGRAITVGSPLTILDSPRDPRLHGSYLACLYSSTTVTPAKAEA